MRHLHFKRFARNGFGRADIGPDVGGQKDHRHHRFGRGGGRPGRIFDHGELRLVVLALIAEKPRHGYEIIKAIEDRLAGSYSPSPGVIYPTLTMLEELGHTTVQETDGKKLYATTTQGAGYLATHQAAVDAALARMNAVSARHGGGPAPQLVRAMENLKMALRLRQGSGPLNTEQLRAIAEIIDGAAIAIERA